ncbi:MAG: energy-coupling factor transporter transmembrane protein EcfT [Syntrophobacteraceae bacterium]|jgi:energy-coupling factor transporter transmembrane protein EcfT|nr:energy-coupling factor transporter transmembrane protein EcfT [Syntrophobacteraceae bacterium]
MFPNRSRASTSCIHSLHPLVKTGAGAAFSMLALVLKNPISLGIVLMFLLCVLKLARLELGARRWLGFLAFVSVVSFFNSLASDSTWSAASYTLRLMVFMMAVPVFALTTAPQDMVRALSGLRLPPGVMVSLLLVWRFFPVVAGDAREILEAGLLREDRGRGRVTRWYRGFVVPLTFCIVDYADRLPLALELRGFDPCRTRTRFQAPRFGRSDLAFITGSQGVVLLAVAFQWWGVSI